ncbi:MAG: 30S ribosomal protein S9 [Nitrospina sp.]|jgi:small subunit ribosomal protein S9|nr:30S ribosomal protein S9 [Nitrospina sp.]MBT3413768.1 30S ribosomal protein S9 [Nitrospina sp.]MBT3857733.1 30S ribosomal protein S9 [Nitrospina sp.]MBT4105462.1 30S ribosomal protein S9 [Nitrospina sp.]MBT4390017.1 30S ribosomal protein S9 [Nitrospina sp.]
MEGTIEKFYATGKRKDSIAKVWVQQGEGKISVNNKSLKEYFCRESLECIVKHPLITTETLTSVDIHATVHGGGLSGQSGALRLGISRALILTNSELRAPLKKAGFLTRDSRTVERKKYGQPGARKKFQFSKR